MGNAGIKLFGSSIAILKDTITWIFSPGKGSHGKYQIVPLPEIFYLFWAFSLRSTSFMAVSENFVCNVFKASSLLILPWRTRADWS